jgi:predicted Holliday junction resolvase-like endonuclease
VVYHIINVILLVLAIVLFLKLKQIQKRARHVKYEMSKTIQTDKCVEVVKPNSNESTASSESSGNEVF